MGTNIEVDKEKKMLDVKSTDVSDDYLAQLNKVFSGNMNLTASVGKILLNSELNGKSREDIIEFLKGH